MNDWTRRAAPLVLALLIALPPIPQWSLAAADPTPILDWPTVEMTQRVSSDKDAAATRTGPLLATTSLTAAARVPETAKSEQTPSRRYINLTGFPFPLGPFVERKTVETVLVKDRVYSFEQEQSLSGITANVRSVVFRMRDNRLLVYNPVAPTEEFLRQLDALGHDGVAHILLGSTAYEHKIFVGPFSRKFPSAKVWAVPDQWSYPLNLPAPLLGINIERTGGGELSDSADGSKAYANAPELTSEFEVKLLRPRERLGFGYAANEAAVLHKDTKTLAVTDALINVPAQPPEIYDRGNLIAVGDNERGTNSLGNIILKAAATVNWRGTAARELEELWTASDTQSMDESSQLQRGWERNTLLSIYFGPSPSSLADPDASFRSIQGKWIVAPVTDSLIYRSDRVRPALGRWIEDITRWDISMIAPAHFDALSGNADDVRAAFASTLARPSPAAVEPSGRPYNLGDVRLLDEIASGLIKLRVI